MTDHYYSENPESELRPQVFRAILRGLTFTFHTASGVFSKDHVDKGSMLLANNIEVRDGDRFLDLGCGYGAVGISVAKSVPGSVVVMSDVNKRAVGLAIKNIKENSARNATVITSDLYENIEGEYDIIATNPPQNAGKAVCTAMMDGALAHLRKGGRFYFVARHKKGGKSLSEHLEGVFGNLEVISIKSGFRVYCSVKK